MTSLDEYRQKLKELSYELIPKNILSDLKTFKNLSICEQCNSELDINLVKEEYICGECDLRVFSSLCECELNERIIITCKNCIKN